MAEATVMQDEKNDFDDGMSDLIERTLPCGHKAVLLPDDDLWSHKCQEIIIQELPCSHATSVPCCHQEKIRCTEIVNERMKCGREISHICGKSSNHRCKSRLPLPCGHYVKCHYDLTTYKCNSGVKYTLPCGHKAIISCHTARDESRISSKREIARIKRNIKNAQRRCKKSCRVKLSFNNPCPGICGECFSSKIHKSCTKVNQTTCSKRDKRVSEQHDMQVNSDNASKISTNSKGLKNGRSCSISDLVEVLFTCGHTAKLSSEQDIQSFSCPFEISVELPCGHTANIPCFRQADLSNVKCSKIIVEGMKCGAEVEHLCSKSPKHKCKSPPQLSCGHYKKCHFDLATYECAIVVNHTLPCGHIAKTSCHIARNEGTILSKKFTARIKRTMRKGQKRCKDSCTVQFSCGHPCPGECGKCFRSQIHKSCTGANQTACPKCMHMVSKQQDVEIIQENNSNAAETKTTEETAANFKISDHIETLLRCGHTIKLLSQQDVQSFLCPFEISVELPCGHIANIPCHRQAHLLDIKCKQVVVRQMKCGAKVKRICSNPPDHRCKSRPTLPCGHDVMCQFDLATYKCRKRIKHTFNCGHQFKTRCHVLDNKRLIDRLIKKDHKDCMKSCTVQFSCGHLCTGICGECFSSQIHKSRTKGIEENRTTCHRCKDEALVSNHHDVEIVQGNNSNVTKTWTFSEEPSDNFCSETDKSCLGAIEAVNLEYQQSAMISEQQDVELIQKNASSVSEISTIENKTADNFISQTDKSCIDANKAGDFKCQQNTMVSEQQDVELIQKNPSSASEMSTIEKQTADNFSSETDKSCIDAIKAVDLEYPQTAMVSEQQDVELIQKNASCVSEISTITKENLEIADLDGMHLPCEQEA